MLLNDLLKAADVLESAGDCSANVSSLEFDSRRVTPGALFFATRGTQADGHAFIEAAVGAGAVAVVVLPLVPVTPTSLSDRLGSP